MLPPQVHGGEFVNLLSDPVSSNNDRHPVSKTFIPLHCTFQHCTSSHLNFTHLHFTILHCPVIWLNPIWISYHSISPHLTSLNLTSLHCTFRQFLPQCYSFHFILFIIAFLTLFLKILGLQGKVPNASASSWLQFFFWSYLQTNNSQYPFFASCP